MKLTVFPHVAMGAEGDEVFQRIVAELTAFDLVVHLQVLKRPTLLTAPLVPFKHLLHQSPVNLLTELDPLHLSQH
jgi:hypothetical protein